MSAVIWGNSEYSFNNQLKFIPFSIVNIIENDMNDSIKTYIYPECPTVGLNIISWLRSKFLKYSTILHLLKSYKPIFFGEEF